MTFPHVRLGWRKDPPSPADHSAARTLKATPIPPSASNRGHIVDVLDQGPLGSCTANAILQVVRARHRQQGIARPELGSRLLAYYLARSYQGPEALAIDDGTYLRSVFDGLRKFGFCRESIWPYDTDRFADMPPAVAFQGAADQRQPTAYEKILSVGQARLDDVRRAIAAGYCVAFGTLVSDDFAGNLLGSAPLPPPIGEEIAGGHALVAAEYSGDWFGVVNSWGTDWGERGWCRFSGEYMAWGETTDLWICRQAPVYSDGATS